MMTPMVDKVLSMYGEDVLEFEKYCAGVDAEAEEFVKKHGIVNVPVFFFMKDGELVKRHDGALSLPQFKKLIEYYR